jgi:hypothetical protein
LWTFIDSQHDQVYNNRATCENVGCFMQEINQQK